MPLASNQLINMVSAIMNQILKKIMALKLQIQSPYNLIFTDKAIAAAGTASDDK